MLFEFKEYQESTLDAFSRWFEEIKLARTESEEIMAQLAGRASETSGGLSADMRAVAKNYPLRAWKALASRGQVADPSQPYTDRTDEAGRPIPHVCLKVPTGGGKTLLASGAIERLRQPTGLILWIVPSKAIYEQTWKALRDREHPYRELLNRASKGRVKLLEKDDKFTASDVADCLCIMLLMYPAANRQKGKEFLRMFRDSGKYPSLFPDDDDATAESELLKRFPDLERESGTNTSESGPIKHSLFNVFKMLRPVVILDEAHKAYGTTNSKSTEFVRSVNRLDPGLVIELSATPRPGISNLLVDVSGPDLHREEMIKLPVKVSAEVNSDWQQTLADAHEHMERFAADAEALQHREGRYIRPIAVVRVERIGKDQRDSGFLHADDVHRYLTTDLNQSQGEMRREMG